MPDESSEAGRSPRWRLLLYGIALAYLIFTVFLGGFPLRDSLPAFVLSGKSALALLAFCILLDRGAFRNWKRETAGEGLAVAVILAAAGYLRCQGIAAAAMSGPTIDEPIIVEPVLNMLRTGSLDPHAYEYGGVWFYILLAAFVVFIARSLSGFAYKEASEIPSQAFYTAGRYAAALLSLLTVGATYVTARRFFGRFPAIVAGAVLAVSSLAYTTAHQIRLDVPLALFVLAAHYFYLRLLDEDSAMNSLGAGLFTGLAIGTKYTVLPLAVSLLLAHLLAAKEKRVTWNLLLSLVTAAVTFVAFNFFAFAHLNDFLDRLPRAMVHNLSPEHWSAADNRPLLYFAQLAGEGIGAAALITALLTLGKIRENRILLMWCFPLLYLALIGSYPSGFPRYLMPVLPLLAILSGAGAQDLAGWLGQRLPKLQQRPGLVGAALCLLLIAAPVWGTAAYLLDAQNVLRPQEVVDWVKSNIPPGSAIVADPTGPILPPDQYEVTTPTYRDFQAPRTFRDAQYLCITEDLFHRVPAGFQVLHEFPARTRDLDRTIRIYVRN